MKKKNSKNNTKKKQPQKITSLFVTPQNILSWTFSNNNKEQNKWLADKLIEWVKKDDALSLMGFTVEYGLLYKDFIKRAEKDEYLNKAKDYAKEVIGIRKQRLAELKEYGANPTVILQTIRLYHPDFRECYDEEKKHQKETNNITELLEFFKNKEAEIPELDEENKVSRED